MCPFPSESWLLSWKSIWQLIVIKISTVYKIALITIYCLTVFCETQWPRPTLFSPSLLIQWSMGEGSYITLFSPSDVTAFHRMKYGGGGYYITLLSPSDVTAFHRIWFGNDVYTCTDLHVVIHIIRKDLRASVIIATWLYTVLLLFIGGGGGGWLLVLFDPLVSSLLLESCCVCYRLHSMVHNQLFYNNHQREAAIFRRIASGIH